MGLAKLLYSAIFFSVPWSAPCFWTPGEFSVYLLLLTSGVYILASQKKFPLKFFPVFVDFFAVFKLHKGILTCILSLFSFFPSFPPFSLPFFKSSFKFFPVFQFGQMARIYVYPWHALLAISLPGIIIIFIARFFCQKLSFKIYRILLAQVDENRLRISRNAFLRLSEGDMVVRDRRGRGSALFSFLSSMKDNVMMLLAVHSLSYCWVYLKDSIFK